MQTIYENFLAIQFHYRSIHRRLQRGTLWICAKSWATTPMESANLYIQRLQRLELI